jgi:uncharacterized membrane protein
MTAPAVVSWAANRGWIQPLQRRTALLGKKAVPLALSTFAIGELVVDKLPSTPNRTQPVALAIRAVTGGFAGAILWASRERSAAFGAVLGATGAIAGAFVGYETRRRLRKKLRVGDSAIAVAEDAVAVGGGVLLLRAA